MRDYHKTIPGTMMDFEAFYKRIAEELPDNARIFEVGVADGRSAIFMAETLLDMGKKIDRFVIIDNCDYGKDYQRNTIIRNLVKSGVGDFVEFMELASLEASCLFEDNYFNFGFLDSSHKYEQTKAELRLWHHKITDGGILAGHDYFSDENPEVRKAVDEVVVPDNISFEQTLSNNGLWVLKKINKYQVK